MNNAESEFMKALGIDAKQLEELPDFMVKTERDRFRLLLRSKLEALKTLDDWVIITISPQDFLKIQKGLTATLEELKKRGSSS